jgi:FAD:protein FMN transferase
MPDKARSDWRVWSCDASVVVNSPESLEAAVELTRGIIAEIDKACSRFRPDSELAELTAELPAGARVTSTLAELVRGALEAARLTDGDVDPTLGNDLKRLGYDRDIADLDQAVSDVASSADVAAPYIDSPQNLVVPGRAYVPNVADSLVFDGVTVSRSVPRTPGWTRLRLEGSTLTVPSDLALDLGATAKAIAADRAANEAAALLGCAVLVSIGGDIATAGPDPSAVWEVVVEDLPGDPRQQVALSGGSAIATSSTQKRRWLSGGQPQHHILDPRFGLPAEPVWRTVSVAAETCLRANALSTASVVRGHRAIAWLNELGANARLVDRAGRVTTTGAWPTPPETS